MTPGEQFVDKLPRKVRFYDLNERRTYEVTRAVAARLVDDPGLVEAGRQYLERHMRGDPAQGRAVAIWQRLLRRSADEIARMLLEDTAEGALLRDTQPVFCVLPLEVRQSIAVRARAKDVEIAVGEPRP